MRVSGRYRSLGRHASISDAATPSSAGTSVTSVRSPSRSDAKLGRPATSSRAAARLKPSVYAEKLATPELNIRRTMGRGSQRSNGMPTGMSGAGSRPCSNTRRHPRPGVLRDERDPRDPRRQERRKRPARDDDRHAAAAEVGDLGRRPLEQLVVRPHALVGRPDPRDAADELRRPLLGDAVTDQVVGDAGRVEHGPERASVRRDCDLSSALGERSPDLEHPRDLGEEAAVREEADHPSGHLR